MVLKHTKLKKENDMLVCNKCGKDVYVQQRDLRAVYPSHNEPYYCWLCERFKDYNEVEVKK